MIVSRVKKPPQKMKRKGSTLFGAKFDMRVKFKRLLHLLVFPIFRTFGRIGQMMHQSMEPDELRKSRMALLF